MTVSQCLILKLLCCKAPTLASSAHIETEAPYIAGPVNQSMDCLFKFRSVLMYNTYCWLIMMVDGSNAFLPRAREESEDCQVSRGKGRLVHCLHPASISVRATALVMPRLILRRRNRLFVLLRCSTIIIN